MAPNMEALGNSLSLRELLIILTAAALIVPIFYRFRISPVLGYILSGVMLGPYALGALSEQYEFLKPFVITKSSTIHTMSELGVMFLLFAIGLELSFERIKSMRRLIFTLGGLQVAICSIGIALIAWLVFGVSRTASFVIGVALSMSSTAIVMQILTDKNRLIAPEGRASFGILLFQDIAIIPIMFAIPFLSPTNLGLGFLPLVKAILISTFAVAMVLFLGRIILRPIFKLAASINGPEIFMATSLLVVIVTGLITNAAGLSMTLGAFLAGLLLAETEYRREVETTIQPFKGLFLGVFLVSIGVGLNFDKIFEQPLLLISAACALIVVKALIIAFIGPMLGLKRQGATYAGILLGGAGEFAFVLLSTAKTLYVVGPRSTDFALTVAAISMAIVPILAEIMENRGKKPKKINDEIEKAQNDTMSDNGHVIVAGLGKSGELVCSLLESHGVNYVATDMDIDLVGAARKHKKRAYYGDVSRKEFLKACGIDRAKAMVITSQNETRVVAIVKSVREINPKIPIVARAKDLDNARRLYELGVNEAVPSTLESTLQLSEAVLVEAGVPMGNIIVSVHEKRADMRDALREASNSTTPSERLRALKESHEE
ncbi:MAG: cation:proton antiporter [Caulobacterales bacterium]|nr:cation:proton antiporter [Caulobacterales bacterium]MCA0371838.1 cation:proton antiporter [Pseudomonadota bacterium]